MGRAAATIAGVCDRYVVSTAEAQNRTQRLHAQVKCNYGDGARSIDHSGQKQGHQLRNQEAITGNEKDDG